MPTTDVMTRRGARLLEEILGQSLAWVEVTVFGDSEPMVVLLTPRCESCAAPSPTSTCAWCGAGVAQAGDGR